MVSHTSSELLKTADPLAAKVRTKSRSVEKIILVLIPWFLADD